MSFSAGFSPLDDQAEALARRLLDAHPPTRAYTRADLAQLPGLLARLLGARLDAHVADASAPDSPYVDADAASVRAAVDAWRSAARDAARYPAETWEDALAEATRDALGVLVQPATTLAALAFEGVDDGASQPADVAIERVRPAAPVATLPEVAARYVERKDLATLDRAALERLLRRIDRRMAEGLAPDEWAALAAPLFELAGPSVPVALVRAFLDAKGADGLAAQVPASGPPLTREAFRALVGALPAASPDEPGLAVEAPSPPVGSVPYVPPPIEPPTPDVAPPSVVEPATEPLATEEPTLDAAPVGPPAVDAAGGEQKPDEAGPSGAGWAREPSVPPQAPSAPPPVPSEAWKAPEPPAAAPPPSVPPSPAAPPPVADPERLVPPLEPLPAAGLSLDPLDAPSPSAAADVIAPPAHLPPPVPAAPEPTSDDEPLWKRMARSHGSPPPPTAPASPAPPSEGPALWQRFAADAPPAAPLGSTFAAPTGAEPPPAPPAPPVEPRSEGSPAERLVALETRVLGADATERRDWYVRELFGGDTEAYAATLAALNVTRTWTEATQVIARDVLRKHRINIYSEPAVAFTDAVQANLGGSGAGS